MIVHQLKTWPEYFRPLWDGEKTFEIRFDDRGFQRGDVVDLREWDRFGVCDCPKFHGPDCARYTGRRIVAEIGYVTASTAPRGQQRGFRGDGYVVFSLVNVDRVEADDAAAASWTPTDLDTVMAISSASPARMPTQRPPST